MVELSARIEEEMEGEMMILQQKVYSIEEEYYLIEKNLEERYEEKLRPLKDQIANLQKMLEASNCDNQKWMELYQKSAKECEETNKKNQELLERSKRKTISPEILRNKSPASAAPSYRPSVLSRLGMSDYENKIEMSGVMSSHGELTDLKSHAQVHGSTLGHGLTLGHGSTLTKELNLLETASKNLLPKITADVRVLTQLGQEYSPPLETIQERPRESCVSVNSVCMPLLRLSRGMEGRENEEKENVYPGNGGSGMVGKEIGIIRKSIEITGRFIETLPNQDHPPQLHPPLLAPTPTLPTKVPLSKPPTPIPSFHPPHRDILRSFKYSNPPLVDIPQSVDCSYGQIRDNGNNYSSVNSGRGMGRHRREYFTGYDPMKYDRSVDSISQSTVSALRANLPPSFRQYLDNNIN